MQEVSAAEAEVSESAQMHPDAEKSVSTHVLVEGEKVQKLRDLSRRTRVAQSEYLREAVDDLLLKYQSAKVDG